MSYPRPLCPEDFGAKGDGVTNDAPAFIAMFTSLAAALIVGHAQAAEIGEKNYLVNPPATIVVPAGATFEGVGFGSVITTTSNLTLFTVGGQNVYIGKMKIQGNGIGGAQDGIDIGAFPAGPGFENTIVEKVWCQSLGNAGIFMAGGGDTFQHGPLIFGCQLDNCGFVGLWNFFEYSRVIACSFKGNNIGVRCQGGNQIYEGCTVANGTTGFQLVGGGNDGHGYIGGCLINHNTTNVSAINALANGMPFVGCSFFGVGTGINLVSSHGVRYEACTFDISDYFFDGSQETLFQNCLFKGTETNTIHNNFNGNASHTVWEGNVDLTSTGEQLDFTFAANADQTLTFLQSIKRYVIIEDGVLGLPHSLTSLLGANVGQTVFVKNLNGQIVTWKWSAADPGVAIAPTTSALIGVRAGVAFKIMTAA